MRLEIELPAAVAWKANILAQQAGTPAAEWMARVIAERVD